MNSTNNLMKGKKSFTQLIRHIIQIASFILIPGLFILIWNSIGGIYKALISGTFTFSSMSSQFLILLAVIPITVLWGRFFCGYLCAFGSMQELSNFIAKKLHIKQIEIPKKVDKYMKYVKYGILAVMIILWSLNIALGTISPWNVFGMYSTYSGWTDLSSLISIGGFILLLIIISSLFIERFFCKYFCPLGGIFTLISKPRLYKIKKSSSKCVNCNMCNKNCPMNISVNEETTEFGKVKSSECIDCFKCIDVCRSCALYTNPEEAISGTVASVAIAGLYYGGVIASGNSYSMANITSDTTSISQGKYTDGTYEGSAQGYRGTTTVKVTVSNGNITSITIESYKDDDQFFNKAKSTIINEIISSQSTDVNTVSGATFSSNGIINAVANALSSSQISTSQTNSATTTSSVSNSSSSNTLSLNTANSSSSQSTTSSSSTSSVTSTNFSNLADGTYSGTGTGRNGNIKVSVVVKSGKVTSITIESYMEDEQYFSRAKNTIINEIISSQSINVSTVSGATMSSNGIIDAVANALGISFTNPNSTMQNAKGNHGMR